MDILLIIATIWLVAASFTDIKNREIANWLSFSLIVIALSIRATESILSWNLEPLTRSVAGLLIFFVIANALYYGKIFAGGDAKLLIALGAVIPSLAFLSNILIIGSVYGVIYSLGLAITHKKTVTKQLKKSNKNISYGLIGALVFFMIGLILQITLLYLLSAIILLLYYLHIFIKAVEKTCLIKKISTKYLTEGDWIIKDIRIGGKTIKSSFQGLTSKQVSFLKKFNKKVQIKQGIPFIPVFLIAFLATIFINNLFIFLI